MKTSKKGIDLIKKFEGCQLSAYKCPAGVWTIGYGHTSGVRKGMVITQNEADKFLELDLAKFEKQVTSLVKVPLKQGQFDALVSFVYNLGSGVLSTSTMLRLLNCRKYKEAANEFEKFVYADKKILQGLVNRRKAEKELFLS